MDVEQDSALVMMLAFLGGQEYQLKWYFLYYLCSIYLCQQRYIFFQLNYVVHSIIKVNQIL